MFKRILFAITLPFWIIPLVCWETAGDILSDMEQSRQSRNMHRARDKRVAREMAACVDDFSDSSSDNTFNVRNPR
jgi:hypothetical protein